MNAAFLHFVQADRRKSFTSATLPASELERLQQAFRSRSWWLDRWANGNFRRVAREIAREAGGLVLLGQKIPFDVPPPFIEKFEPIEVGRGLGDDTERLKTLSGDKPTREERIGDMLIWIGGIAGAALVAGLVVGYVRGQKLAAMGGLLAGLMLVGLTIAVVVALSRHAGHWFLVPGGIAVIRKPAKRGQPARITVLSRADTCLAMRYIHTGKSSVLIMELWTHAGGSFRRSVTQREAISILASWQGPHEPPADEKLMELVNWEGR